MVIIKKWLYSVHNCFCSQQKVRYRDANSLSIDFVLRFFSLICGAFQREAAVRVPEIIHLASVRERESKRFEALLQKVGDLQGFLGILVLGVGNRAVFSNTEANCQALGRWGTFLALALALVGFAFPDVVALVASLEEEHGGFNCGFLAFGDSNLLFVVLNGVVERLEVVVEVALHRNQDVRNFREVALVNDERRATCSTGAGLGGLVLLVEVAAVFLEHLFAVAVVGVVEIRVVVAVHVQTKVLQIHQQGGLGHGNGKCT